MELWKILADIVMLLTACLIVGGLASRIGQSPLVGYLLAGMVLGGPGSLGLVGSQEEIEAIAELGVALLLFSLGLEFSVGRLRSLGTAPLLGGGLQVVLTIVSAAAIAWGFGMELRQAAAFGAMVSLSSTAVVLRILAESSALESPHGRNSLGVLLTQDIAVVPLAILVTILGGEGTPQEVMFDVLKLIAMAAMLALALYLATRVAVLMLGKLTLHRNRELTVIFAAVMGLGSAWAAHYAGISPALGAFVSGMLLGSSPFATQIRADISPLRVLLLTLFFGAAGMVADPIWIAGHWHVVLAVALALTMGKLIIIAGVFYGLGQSIRVSAATGLCLAQIGEFAFVLGSVGRVVGVVSDDIYALVVSVTILSFFLSALLVPRAATFGDWFAAWFPSGAKDASGEEQTATNPDVVIIGFGPAGRAAAEALVDKPAVVEVIDLNRQGIARAAQLGFHGHVGDATQSEVLEHAKIQGAGMIIVTVPHHASALSIVQLARGMNPHASIIARSRYDLHAQDLSAAGASLVVGDEQQVGQAIAAHLRDH